MHFGDEQQAEEEGEAAQRLLSAFLEGQVIDLINQRAEIIEDRQHQNAGQDRIEAQPLVDDIGDIRPEDDEGRMRDIDDIEDAERDRYADRHGRVEAAQQDAGDQRIDQTTRREIPFRKAPLRNSTRRPVTPDT